MAEAPKLQTLTSCAAGAAAPTQQDETPFNAAAAQAHLESPGVALKGGQEQQQGLQQKQPSSKLRCCLCCGPGPHEQDDGTAGDQALGKEQSTLGALFSRKRSTHRSGTLATQYTDVEWFDALSHATPSSDLTARLAQVESGALAASASLKKSASAAGAAAAAGPVAVGSHLQRQLSALQPWVPDPPLLFAEPGLTWVPVPPVTGFAAIWDMDPARTTPFPQPIDVMLKASFLVRKVHASIAFMTFDETDKQLTVATQPSFVPPGIPSAYREVYDKELGSGTDRPTPSWTPRRDLALGSCYGRLYMTTTGMLVLRAESRAPFSTKVANVTEDYLMLQEGGDVIVDRMCCKCMATGRTATQFYVGRRRKA